jgi:hypothetical protein
VTAHARKHDGHRRLDELDLGAQLAVGPPHDGGGALEFRQGLGPATRRGQVDAEVDPRERGPRVLFPLAPGQIERAPCLRDGVVEAAEAAEGDGQVAVQPPQRL